MATSPGDQSAGSQEDPETTVTEVAEAIRALVQTQRSPQPSSPKNPQDLGETAANTKLETGRNSASHAGVHRLHQGWMIRKFNVTITMAKIIVLHDIIMLILKKSPQIF